VGEGEGLALFAASSAAFAASSAFELAFLGAIAGGFLVARTVGAKCWNLPFGARGSNGGVW
jgi:carbamoylphosphate synthase small subunit